MKGKGTSVHLLHVLLAFASWHGVGRIASVSANSGGTTTDCNPHSNAGCSEWDAGDRLKCTEPDDKKGVRDQKCSPSFPSHMP
jgi:hypothetical protein